MRSVTGNCWGAIEKHAPDQEVCTNTADCTFERNTHVNSNELQVELRYRNNSAEDQTNEYHIKTYTTSLQYKRISTSV